MKVLHDPRRTWISNQYLWFHHSALNDFEMQVIQMVRVICWKWVRYLICSVGPWPQQQILPLHILNSWKVEDGNPIQVVPHLFYQQSCPNLMRVIKGGSLEWFTNQKSQISNLLFWICRLHIVTEKNYIFGINTSSQSIIACELINTPIEHVMC